MYTRFFGKGKQSKFTAAYQSQCYMQCLFCKKPITVGNKGKKFCNENCRTAYHNRIKSDVNEEISKIYRALRNNHKILKQVLGTREYFYITEEKLLKRGFDFDYHTHIKTSKRNHAFIFCFNYGYHKMENEQIKVVKSFRDLST